MNKTILILIIAILIAILGCLIASQVTLEKIDDQIKHFDEVLERSENK